MKSPKSWGGYRYILLLHVILSSFFDQLVLFGGLVPLFPLPILYFDYEYFIEVLSFALACLLMSVISLFVYRHQQLLPQNHPFRLKKVSFIWMISLLTTVVAVMTFYLVTWMKSANQMALGRLFKVLFSGKLECITIIYGRPKSKFNRRLISYRSCTYFFKNQ